MKMEFGRKKQFEKTPVTDLMYPSANIIDLAGHQTPPMPRNIRMTKNWQDGKGTLWQLQELKDPDAELAKLFNGASPIEYQLFQTAVTGAKMSFIYRSDKQMISTKTDESHVMVEDGLQEHQARELLEALYAFPKDQALAEYPIMESWITDRHQVSGVERVRQQYDDIIADDFNVIPSQIERSTKVKKGLFASARDWLGA